MSGESASADSGEHLRKDGHALREDSLQAAYLETRVALSEIRQLYFERVSTEAAAFVRLEAVERRMDKFDASMAERASTEAESFVRLGDSERRTASLEEQLAARSLSEAATLARVGAFERRMDTLEAHVAHVTAALSKKRNLYSRVVWLLFGGDR